MKSYADIDTYIAHYPQKIQVLLRRLRRTIHATAPTAEETIRYGIPTFRLHGNLVHFGAFKNHISFFPASSGVSAFHKELTAFTVSKGTIQFPFDTPLPLTLIQKIVRFRVKENMQRVKKTKRPTTP